MHSRLQEPHFSPHFHSAIGAIDRTYIPVVVHSSTTIAHFGRYQETTPNVLAICDLDMRFIFVITGWPDLVYMSVFFASARYRVVRIVCSYSKVVLRTTKHTIVYSGSGPSLKVIVLHPATTAIAQHPGSPWASCGVTRSEV
jgi:hypothetical protein